MQRLKTRPQFQAALAGGTVARTPHFALHRLALNKPALCDGFFASPATTPVTSAVTHPSHPSSSLHNTADHSLFAVTDVWLGAMVPKRWARRAVTRNAIKRQIYSVSQRFENHLLDAAHVVRLRSAFDRKAFTSASSELLKLAVRQELEQLFARAVGQEVSA